MDTLKTAQIGTTGVNVTRLGLGGAPLGGLFEDVTQEAGVATIQHAYELGVRYFDTAPWYGLGKSETYYGRGLEGLPRDAFAISTKVGYVLDPGGPDRDPHHWVNPFHFEARFDFSREGVLRSLEGSLERLKLDHVDMALIHDPDDHYGPAIEQAYPTLVDLRSQGVVRAIGVGSSPWEPLMRFAEDGDFDCFLVPGRYTLLNQSALAELLPLCVKRGISVILGGPYNTGILASGPIPGATYFNSEAPPEVMERARKVKAVCDRHGVPLKAAALQFGLSHPAIVTTIPGARSASEVEETVRMAGFPIPADLWADLRSEGLIPADAPMPTQS